jgi:hypothetical protein
MENMANRRNFALKNMMMENITTENNGTEGMVIKNILMENIALENILQWKHGIRKKLHCKNTKQRNKTGP